MRGYLPVSGDSQQGLLDMSVEQESIRELSQRKNTLLLELKNYEENQRVSGVPGVPGTALLAQGALGNDMGIIPAQTQLSTALAINLGSDGKPVLLGSRYQQ